MLYYLIHIRLFDAQSSTGSNLNPPPALHPTPTRQVIVVYLGTFIAGTFANQIEQLIDDPSSIVTVLGTSAPQVSIFFLAYITLRGVLLVPLSILRYVPYAIYAAKMKLAATERARAAAWSGFFAEYGGRAANDMLIVLLGGCQLPPRPIGRLGNK